MLHHKSTTWSTGRVNPDVVQDWNSGSAADFGNGPLQVRAGVLVVDGYGIALRVASRGKLRVEDVGGIRGSFAIDRTCRDSDATSSGMYGTSR